MAEHNVGVELYYSGAWQRAPILTRNRIRYMRGSKTPGNDTEPASASATIDNTTGNYAPKSATSALRGLIGQNTPARVVLGSSPRMTGEAASWKPQRPVKGSGWTDLEIAGVLQRIGRGTDPVRSALYRANVGLGPDLYWPMEDGTTAGTDGAGSGLQGGTPLAQATSLAPTWADADDLPGSAPLPKLLDALTDWEDGLFVNPGPGSSTSAWTVSIWFKGTIVDNTITIPIELITWGGKPDTARFPFEFDIYKDSSLNTGYVFGLDFSAYCTITKDISGDPFDGGWHHIVGTCTQNGANLDMALYVDGVLMDASTTSSPAYTQRAVQDITLVRNLPESDPSLVTLHVGHLAVFPRVLTDDEIYDLHWAGRGWVGETAAARFVRLCAEEGLDSTLRYNTAGSMAMGPQRTVTLLELFDEIARTDNGWIFETRAGAFDSPTQSLTMATGVGLLNQAPAMTINYYGHVAPPLVPVYGDVGIRNDVTARNPGGSTRQVVQETGPHNVQLPQDDPQGVGRYRTSIDVNTELDESLSDQAGWRVNVGTFDGTWYAEVTLDVDAATTAALPGLSTLDIGDVVALVNLPADEAVDAFEGIVIGMAEDLPAKRRLVTLYLVPNEPYRVGLLAQTSGDTDPFSAHLDPDGSTTAAAIAVGAASFTVATPSGPLWSTVADDYPMDLYVGGQRVSVSAVSGGTSPQTFTVQSGGYQVRYAVAAGEIVEPYQPLILAL